jgi:hypothetical protein
MNSPTVPSVDERGYAYVETADWWKKGCEGLPSFSAVCWPGYATAVVPVTIGGQELVIQLWKGLCEQFMFRSDFPGGVGAEVGIYQRTNGKAPPDNLPGIPTRISQALLGLTARLGGKELWWPYLQLEAPISFELINPVTGEAFFSAEPQLTYWRNRWMEPASYEKYKNDQQGRIPGSFTDFQLVYRIGDTEYRW